MMSISEETREKLRLSHLGHKHSEETKQKMRLAHLGENNHEWKGDKVGKISLHKWVRKHLPEPRICDNCKERKKLDLANITGNYTRDLSNWRYLCRRCHVYHDGTIYNLKHMKRTPIDAR